MTEQTDQLDTVELATELTIAWLGNSNTRVEAADVPAFLKQMHDAITQLGTPDAAAAEETSLEYTPAVSVRKSLASPDHIISMIDGKPYRMLKRHLAINGLTPAEYRSRYGLKADYPMTATTYSEARRAMAHKIGLGSKARQAKEAVVEPVKAVAKKARKTVTDATKAAQAHLGGSSEAE